MHILIVEDEPQMAGLLTRGLEEESYQVSVARDGRAGARDRCRASLRRDSARRDAATDGRPRSGQAVAWPRRGKTPVLMVDRRAMALGDIVKGLDAGADDYLTKPFSFVELLARMRAPRAPPAVFGEKNVLEVQDLVSRSDVSPEFPGGGRKYIFQ